MVSLLISKIEHIFELESFNIWIDTVYTAQFIV